MRRPTLRHRLEHLGFRFLSGAVGVLPESAARGLGTSLGWLAGSVLRIRRKEVDRHLEWAFPEKSAEWRSRVAAACYRHLGREAVATFAMAGLDTEEIRRRTRVVGTEPIREAKASGRGAVIVTGHLGNWELAGAALAAHGVPLSAVALRQGNPLFDADLVDARRRLGMEVIYKEDATRGILRVLRRGGVVAIVADQNPIQGGITVDFFGRPANTARGPAVLALRSGARLFHGVGIRTEGSGGARRGPEDRGFTVTFEEVPFTATGDFDADAPRLVQAYTRVIEEWVREHPEQYFWQHRRWKERNH